MGTGCKVLLTIAAVLIVLLGAAMILSYVYCDKISSALIERSTDALQGQVLNDLPEGYQAEDIKAAFKDFKEALKSGDFKDKLKADKVKAFALEVQKALNDKKIDKDELDKILQSMKDIVGK